MDPFPTQSAEIKQTLPQITFLSQRQLVLLLVVLHHLLELLLKTNLKGILKNKGKCNCAIGALGIIQLRSSSNEILSEF